MTPRNYSLMTFGIITLFLIVGCKNSNNTSGSVEAIKRNDWAMIVTRNGSVVLNQDGWATLDTSSETMVPVSKEHSDKITKLCIFLLNNFHVDHTKGGSSDYEHISITVGFNRQASYYFYSKPSDLPRKAIELKTLIVNCAEQSENKKNPNKTNGQLPKKARFLQEND